VIRILTVEREYGCGGGAIARKIADRLGWTLWDEALTSEIARLSHCDPAEVEAREEQVDPIYYRLLTSIMRGSFEGSLNVHRLTLLDADSIFRLTERVVQKAAAAGNCVIVGRGSQHFLRDRVDTVRVFLYAPREEKVRRLMSDGVCEKDVGRLVDTIDHDRTAFVDRYFHMPWPNRPLYHAMLNTAAGDDLVIQMILILKETLERQSESPH
jgi:cytidylate kinase